MPIPGTKEVLFRDDFAGPSLDLTRWVPNWLGQSATTITPPINGHEVSCYDPAQVSIGGAGGKTWLELRAIAKQTVDSHGSRYDYASGCVTTRPHFTFSPPALVEARIWLPGETSIDNWPAFWCDGTGQWPVTGELDVMEGLGGHAAFHFHSSSTGAGGSGAIEARPHGIGWHRFGALWTPDSVKFLYDGAEVGELTEGITDAPMYVILNLALSPSISPPVKVPSEMRVDWVQVSRPGSNG